MSQVQQNLVRAEPVEARMRIGTGESILNAGTICAFALLHLGSEKRCRKRAGVQDTTSWIQLWDQPAAEIEQRDQIMNPWKSDMVFLSPCLQVLFCTLLSVKQTASYTGSAVCPSRRATFRSLAAFSIHSCASGFIQRDPFCCPLLWQTRPSVGRPCDLCWGTYHNV